MKSFYQDRGCKAKLTGQFTSLEEKLFNSSLYTRQKLPLNQVKMHSVDPNSSNEVYKCLSAKSQLLIVYFPVKTMLLPCAIHRQ